MLAVGVGIGVGLPFVHLRRGNRALSDGLYMLDDDGAGGWVWSDAGRYGLVDDNGGYSWGTPPQYGVTSQLAWGAE